MSDATNVTAAKPSVGGAIYVADVGATMPTDATSTIGSDFSCLGYISSDGVKNNTNRTASTTKAWGGDVVLVTDQGIEDTLSYTLIEMLNTDVLTFVFGADNVSGTLSAGITVNVNSTELDHKAIVIDMILKSGVLKRICVPEAAITSVGEVTYDDSNIAGYSIETVAIADSAGNTHYEYYSTPTSES